MNTNLNINDKNKNIEINKNILFIDSLNQNQTMNLSIFPSFIQNPFKSKVNFNPLNNQDNFYIEKKFTNIKYIKLIDAYLPNLYHINTTILSNLETLPDENNIINNLYFNNQNYNENINLEINNVNYIIINNYKIVFDKIDFSITSTNLNN